MRSSFFEIVNYIYLLPHIAILVGCFIYVSRVSGSEGALMLTGQLLTFLGDIAFRVIHVLRFKLYFFENNVDSIHKIAMAVILIGSILFAIGFVIMAAQQKRPQNRGVYY